MFHRHSSVAEIQRHLNGIEYELRRLGRDAGRQASGSVAALRNQIAETVIPLLNEVAHLLHSSPRFLGTEAARLRNDALRAGTHLSRQTLNRVASEVEHRPVMLLAVLLGLGILIGLAGRHRVGN
jgi:hypothetical protein